MGVQRKNAPGGSTAVVKRIVKVCFGGAQPEAPRVRFSAARPKILRAVSALAYEHGCEKNELQAKSQRDEAEWGRCGYGGIIGRSS